MAQTVANMTSIIKDAWTSEEVAKQFYNENPLLAKIRSFKATTIGLQAQVPIHAKRAGTGYTSTDAAGGSLNPASNQQTAQATYTLVYHWFQISLETGALNQTASSVQAIMSAKDLEMRGAIDDVSKQCSRQLASNGDSVMAACATGGASTTVSLLPSTVSISGTPVDGYSALQRGWLYPGMQVDIGTTADSDALVTASPISAVSESTTAPSITIGSSISTTQGTHFVYMPNPNSATAPNPELNGLGNLAGGTGSVGGINPASAGSEYWQPAVVDTTTTSFSLDLALNLQRAVFQKTGKFQSAVLTSAKQMASFYSLLQNQVRFSGDMGLSAGNVGGLVGLSWNGVGVNVFPDIVDHDWYHLTLDDFVRITGDITEPTWVSDLEGAGGSFRWAQGNTNFVNGLVFPFQVGVQRRNSHAAARALVA